MTSRAATLGTLLILGLGPRCASPEPGPALSLTLALPQVDLSHPSSLATYGEVDEDGALTELRVLVIDQRTLRSWSPEQGLVPLCSLRAGSFYDDDWNCVFGDPMFGWSADREDDAVLIAADASLPLETLELLLMSLGGRWSGQVDLLVEGNRSAPLPSVDAGQGGPIWLELSGGTASATFLSDTPGVPYLRLEAPNDEATLPELLVRAAGGPPSHVLVEAGRVGSAAPALALLSSSGIPIGLRGLEIVAEASPPPKQLSWALSDQLQVLRLNRSPTARARKVWPQPTTLAWCLDEPDEALGGLLESRAAHVAWCLASSSDGGPSEVRRTVEVRGVADSGALGEITTSGDQGLSLCLSRVAATWPMPEELIGPVSFRWIATQEPVFESNMEVLTDLPGFDPGELLSLLSATSLFVPSCGVPQAPLRATLRGTVEDGVPTTLQIDGDEPLARCLLHRTWSELLEQGAKTPTTGDLRVRWTIVAAEPPWPPEGCITVDEEDADRDEAPEPESRPEEALHRRAPAELFALSNGLSVRVGPRVLELRLVKLERSAGNGDEQPLAEELRLPLLRHLGALAPDLAACMPGDGSELAFDFLLGRWGGLRILNDHCMSPVRSSVACVDEVFSRVPKEAAPGLGGTIRLAWSSDAEPEEPLPAWPPEREPDRVGPELRSPPALRAALEEEAEAWARDVDVCVATWRYWSPDATGTVDLALLVERGRVVELQDLAGWRLDDCLRRASKDWALTEPLSGPLRLTVEYPGSPP